MLKPVATNGDLFNISNSKFPYEKIKARYFEFYPFMFISFKIPQCSPTRKDMKKFNEKSVFQKKRGGVRVTAILDKSVLTSVILFLKCVMANLQDSVFLVGI